MASKNGLGVLDASQIAPTILKGYRLAEPDLQDFLALSNARYGVVAGCSASIVGSNIILTETSNIVLVNSNVRYLPTTAALPLLAPASLDRFDVLIWDDTVGSLRLVEGTPATDPVTPDISDQQVLLYLLWVPAGVTSLNNNYLVDKRVLLPASLSTSVADEDIIVINTRGSGDTPFTIQGDGRTTWQDVTLYRSSARTLSVSDSFTVGNGITGQTVRALGNMRAEGTLSSSNFDRGFGAPTGPQGVTTDIWIQEDSGGAIWFKTDSGWAKLLGDVAVGDDPVTGVPPGTVLSSLLPPGHRYLNGYLPLDGSTHAAAAVARLWTLAAQGVHPFIDWCDADPNFGGTTMTFPNANGAVPLQRSDGTMGSVRGSNLKSITTQNLPPHSHFSSSQTAIGGIHSHSGSIAGGSHTHDISGSGVHSHLVNDPKHHHVGTDQYAQYFIGVVWGGNNKLDGPFNDASHTWTVDVAAATDYAATGITISTDGSAHSHAVGQDNHTHTVTIDVTGGHTHQMPTENIVGLGQPLDITPSSLGVKFYVKV
jgi:hypothetical protein